MTVHRDTCKEQTEKQNTKFILTTASCICSPAKSTNNGAGIMTATPDDDQQANANAFPSSGSNTNSIQLGDLTATPSNKGSWQVKSAALGTSAEATSKTQKQTQEKK